MFLGAYFDFENISESMKLVQNLAGIYEIDLITDSLKSTPRSTEFSSSGNFIDLRGFYRSINWSFPTNSFKKIFGQIIKSRHFLGLEVIDTSIGYTLDSPLEEIHRNFAVLQVLTAKKELSYGFFHRLASSALTINDASPHSSYFYIKVGDDPTEYCKTVEETSLTSKLSLEYVYIAVDREFYETIPILTLRTNLHSSPCIVELLESRDPKPQDIVLTGNIQEFDARVPSVFLYKLSQYIFLEGGEWNQDAQDPCFGNGLAQLGSFSKTAVILCPSGEYNYMGRCYQKIGNINNCRLYDAGNCFKCEFRFILENGICQSRNLTFINRMPK